MKIRAIVITTSSLSSQGAKIIFIDKKRNLLPSNDSARSEIGIIALVDEPTGYEKIMGQRAFAVNREKFIAKVLQPWTKTFSYEFYEHIFHLKSWPKPQGMKDPRVIGRYTNDIV